MKFRVPADIDMADRIFAGLTLRQLAILGADALLLWVLFFALGRHVPPPLFGAIAVPFAALGLAVATARPEGVHLERLLASAFRFGTSPRKRVIAPEGIPLTPAWAGSVETVAPLDLPLRDIDNEGILQLGSSGTAVLGEASALNFSLRSEDEQILLVQGFGRLLNALDGPVQFVIRSEATDLRNVIANIESTAGGLPHPALDDAAREHAAFLSSLASRRDILRRHVFVCFRDAQSGSDAGARLLRRFDEAGSLLRGIGVILRRLQGIEAVTALARASNAEPTPSNGLRLPKEVIA